MRGLLFLYEQRNNFISFLSTIYDRLKMRIWGIKYGKNCIFRGSTLFFKCRGSNISIGNNCEFNSTSYFNFRGINHRCIIQTGRKSASIVIGNNCGFSGCSIVSNCNISIGNHVLCGANVIIGDRDDHEDIYSSESKPIIIGNNVWLGMNVTVMKGVTIGNNSIIGAGSIVTHNIPNNVIAVGIPAKVIKQRQ